MGNTVCCINQIRKCFMNILYINQIQKNCNFYVFKTWKTGMLIAAPEKLNLPFIHSYRL